MRRIIARSLAIAGSMGITLAFGQGLTEVKPEVKQRAIDSFKVQERGYLENKGQWDSRAKFLARTDSLDVWLTNNGWVFDQSAIVEAPERKRIGRAVIASFIGAKSSPLQKINVLPGKMDFLFNNRKATDVRKYNEVFQSDLYPGIDLRNYFDGSSARHDLIVKPGANPSAIKLRLQGAEKLSLTPSGDVVVGKKDAGFTIKGLYAYQNQGSKKVQVPASYVLKGNTLSFKVGSYDKSKPLVLDPVTVTYGSYYGGDLGKTEIRGVYADRDGSVYITGRTNANDFPTTPGGGFYTFNIIGGWDAFIARLQGDVFIQDFSAIFGTSDDDEGAYLQRDAEGNIWVAGLTSANSFIGSAPKQASWALRLQDVNGRPNAGTMALNIDGTIVTIPFNASPAAVESAINTAFGRSVVTCSGGNLPDLSVVMTFATGFGNSVTVDTTQLNARVQLVTDRSIGTLIPFTGTAPTTGNVVLRFSGSRGSFNATITFPLDLTVANTTILTEAQRAGFPLGAIMGTSKFAGGNLLLINETAMGTATGISIVSQTTDQFLLITAGKALIQDPTRPPIRAGYFKFSTSTGTTPGASVGDTVATITGLLNTAAVSLNGGTGGPFYNSIDADTSTFRGLGFNMGFEYLGGPIPAISDTLLLPKSSFKVVKQKHLFVMRWKKDANKVLDPEVGSEKLKMFGGSVTPFVPNFKIILSSSTLATDPVKIGFGGTAFSSIPELDTISGSPWAGEPGFVFRTDFNPSSGAFTDQSSSHYIGAESTLGINCTGVDFDSEGNQYVSGTVSITGNQDTQQPGVTPLWTTTPGIFSRGSLLRQTDVWVRKYNSDGTLRWSGLLGGGLNDTTYGPDMDQYMEPMANGSTVAVDQAGNVYVTGTSRSSDFTRTRGVFGENFPSFPIGFLSKISGDGSTLSYSTALNNASGFRASGVIVDQVGNAWVHGVARDTQWFTRDGIFFERDERDDLNVLPFPTVPPVVLNPASIPTTADALSARVQGLPWGSPQGFLVCISADGTSQLFGSYVGMGHGTTLFKPFVDTFGDLWFYGMDSSRFILGYETPTTTGTPAQIDISLGAFPWITSNALKRNIPNGGDARFTGMPMWSSKYYSSTGRAGNLTPEFMINATEYAPVVFPWSGSVSLRQAGYIGRLRYRFPAVLDLGVPAAVPPGTVVGTIVMNQAVPGSGITVDVSTNDPATVVVPAKVNLAGGSTTGTFNFTANQVQVPTPVDITVNYANSIVTKRVVVTPVLESLSANPDNFPGGTTQTGNIKLAFGQAAGQSVTVALSTDRPDLLTFPQPQITIAGVNGLPPIDNAAFSYVTQGVFVPTPVNINATYQNATKSIKVTLLPARLTGIVFDPSIVHAGASTTATLRFDGKPPVGQKMSVDISIPGLTAGTHYPASLDFTGTTGNTLTFPISTPILDISRTYLVTANRRADANYTSQTVTGTFQADPNTLLDFTLSANTVNSGSSIKGNVLVSLPSRPTGTPITVSSSDPSVLIVGTAGPAQTATVSVGSSVTTAQFDIQTQAVSTDLLVTLTATRGSVSISRTLTVKSASLALTLDRTSVAAGGTVRATLTLNAVAPTGGLRFNISGDNSVVDIPTTVTVPAGSNTASFDVKTKFIPTTTETTITASSGGVSSSVKLTILGQGVSISFDPAVVPGGNSSVATVTLTDPATSDLTLTLSSENELGGTPVATPVQTSITIRRGQQTGTFDVNTTAVVDNTNVIFKATSGATVLAQGTLVVEAPQMTGIRFSPSRVKGGKSTICTITLGSEAPVGGYDILLSQTNASLLRLPNKVHIPEGARTFSFTIISRRVSRTLSSSVTAQAGNALSGTVTVVR